MNEDDRKFKSLFLLTPDASIPVLWLETLLLCYATQEIELAFNIYKID